MTQSLVDKHLTQLVVSLFKMMVVKLLIDRFMRTDLNAKLLLDGTDSDGLNDGEQLATENAGEV